MPKVPEYDGDWGIYRSEWELLELYRGMESSDTDKKALRDYFEELTRSRRRLGPMEGTEHIITREGFIIRKPKTSSKPILL